jgi:hypothetical protein
MQVELLSSGQETLWDGSCSSITSIPWGTHVGREGGNAIHKPHISTGLTSGSCTLSCICMLCAPRDSFTGQLSAVAWVYSVIYIERLIILEFALGVLLIRLKEK